jgi:hypothetical protein
MKSYKCICCGFEIKPVDPEWVEEINPEENMWIGGVVVKTHMPFGSSLDSNVYIIGICDKCIEQKEKRGIIQKI